MVDSFFREFVSKLVKNDFLFATYRNADSDRIEFQIQLNPKINFGSFPDSGHGFIIAPFSDSHANTIWISPDVSGTSNKPIPEIPGPPDYSKKFESHPVTFLDHESYLQKITSLKTEMRKEGVGKVVFSRQIPFSLKSTNSVDLFFSLVESNKDAFVYLVNLPGNIQYIGATPEILLDSEDRNARTMALAGTKKFSISGENVEWSAKEIEEQQLVQNYIDETLSNYDLKVNKGETFTKYLDSSLAHICTNYNLESKENFDWSLLARSLHPTSAVCGIPLKKAQKLIEKFENYKRGYYTGFLGPINISGVSKLYVNLRCAEVIDNKGTVFVGGGITQESDPEDEWNETESKSQTILQHVESGSKL